MSLLFILLCAIVPANLYRLSDSALKNSMRIVGGVGSGKSRLLGRLIAFQTLLRGKPQVIIDPTGSVTANLLDKILRLPAEIGKRLLSRIEYVGVGATDFLVGSPLYYRLHEHETLFAIANRFVAVLRRQDPALQSAPILGFNALYECGINAGQIAAALGRQLDFVADLLEQPQQYKTELTQALAQYPELKRAVIYFREMMDPNSHALRERRTGSFANKLLPFVADPTLLAAYAAPTRRIDYEKSERQGNTLILDLHKEEDPDRLQFAYIWWLRDVMAFAKHRGLAGRGREIVLLIDEISSLVGQHTGAGNAVLADDLNELISIIARQYGLSTVVAHQSLSQLDDQVHRVLMGCGNQMVGHVEDHEDALILARKFFEYDPFWVKRFEPMWMNIQQGVEPSYSAPRVIDFRELNYTPEEQLLLSAAKFRLPKFQFWLRPATSEGMISDRLYKISIERLDAGQYPDAGQVDQVLKLLRQKGGVPIDELLAEIRSRKRESQIQLQAQQEGQGRQVKRHKQKQVKSDPAPAILDTNSPPPYDATQPLSTDSDTAVSAPTAVAPDEEEHHDPFWQ